MANPYFSFKQFTVYHDRCAMKVGIDGVLLGCWADSAGADRVLDVGTGTGLIALMIAQRCNAAIDGIDIDEGAFEQASINVAASPWADRIKVSLCSLQDFKVEWGYDLIVSNPPYFIDSLKTPDDKRTTARHTDCLTHEELINYSSKLLAQTGRICLILPVLEGLRCIEYAGLNGLYCTRLVEVHPTPVSGAKRLLIELSFCPAETKKSQLIIEESRHVYSARFAEMAKDYYLKL